MLVSFVPRVASRWVQRPRSKCNFLARSYAAGTTKERYELPSHTPEERAVKEFVNMDLITTSSIYNQGGAIQQSKTDDAPFKLTHPVQNLDPNSQQFKDISAAFDKVNKDPRFKKLKAKALNTVAQRWQKLTKYHMFYKNGLLYDIEAPTDKGQLDLYCAVGSLTEKHQVRQLLEFVKVYRYLLQNDNAFFAANLKLSLDLPFYRTRIQSVLPSFIGSHKEFVGIMSILRRFPILVEPVVRNAMGMEHSRSEKLVSIIMKGHYDIIYGGQAGQYISSLADQIDPEVSVLITLPFEPNKAERQYYTNLIIDKLADFVEGGVKPNYVVKILVDSSLISGYKYTAYGNTYDHSNQSSSAAFAKKHSLPSL